MDGFTASLESRNVKVPAGRSVVQLPAPDASDELTDAHDNSA